MPLTSDVSANSALGRTSEAEVYAQIITDLTDAVAALVELRLRQRRRLQNVELQVAVADVAVPADLEVRVPRAHQRVGAFPTEEEAVVASREVGGVRASPDAAGFPGCQLDKPTWRYLTSRRRFSCICRFPLGFLSHVSGRERPPSETAPRCPREVWR